MKKRLYKSKTNKVICGVIGGIGEYVSIDPVILRLIWIVIVVFTGFIPGTIAYLLAAAVTPYRPEIVEEEAKEVKKTEKKPKKKKKVKKSKK